MGGQAQQVFIKKGSAQKGFQNCCLNLEVNPSLLPETELAALDNGKQWEWG